MNLDGSSRDRTGLVLLVALAILVVIGVLVYLNNLPIDRAPTIKLIVPRGFSGLVEIRESVNGRPLQFDRNARAFVIAIGPDGTVVLNDVSPFAEWHSLAAEYTDGKRIPVADFDATSPTEPAVFGLPTITRDGLPIVRFLVGLETDYDSLVK